MTNEYEEDKDLQEEEVELDFELEDDIEEEKPEPKKPTESLEARKARLERQLSQTLKKMGVNREEKKNVPTQTNDLGESAFLIANGIKDSEERALAKKLAKETGKDLESLLDTTYFQTELKAHREAKATQDATPSGNKRAGNSSSDSVEYWIAKGELPPSSEVELRRAVVNARMKKTSDGTQFYNS